MSITRECSLDWCKNKYSCSGYCNRHYIELRKHGSITQRSSHLDKRNAIIEGEIAKIPIGLDGKDGYAIVDKEFAWLDKFRWCLHGKNKVQKYACRREEGSRSKLIFLHHAVLKPLTNGVIDHINRNTLDNRSVNLRQASRSENIINSSPPLNKTGFVGVKEHSTLPGGFMARINFGNKEYYLGSFKSAEAAAEAYNEKALELHGIYARINIV